MHLVPRDVEVGQEVEDRRRVQRLGDDPSSGFRQFFLLRHFVHRRRSEGLREHAVEAVGLLKIGDGRASIVGVAKGVAYVFFRGG